MTGDDAFEKRTSDVVECMRHVLTRRFPNTRVRGAPNEDLLKELACVAVTYCDSHPVPTKEPQAPSMRDVRELASMFEMHLCEVPKDTPGFKKLRGLADIAIRTLDPERNRTHMLHLVAAVNNLTAELERWKRAAYRPVGHDTHDAL